MCGRFVSATPPDELAAHFGAEAPSEHLLEANHNVAPTADVYTVVESRTDTGRRLVEAMRWGLLPAWAKDVKVGNRMFNARSETVATSNAFRSSFAKRRCIVPVDGFYEWQRHEDHPDGRASTPHYIDSAGGGPLAFAGIWSVWRPSEDESDWVLSCSVLTTAPNALMAPIHDRMPVILPSHAWSLWLDRTVSEPGQLSALLAPAPEDLLRLTAVSSEVNNSRNRGVELTTPVDPETGEALGPPLAPRGRAA